MIYSEDSGPFGHSNKEKTIKVYKNGDSSVFFQLKLRQNYKPEDVLREISSNLGFSSKKTLRFFNVQGVEISVEELDYIENGETLHISGGEDFDQFSSFAEYRVDKVLGEGGFGKVVLGTHRETKEKVAIKLIHANKFGTTQDIDMIFSEMETLKELHHENIVRIFKWFSLRNSQLAYVMEYMEGGELLGVVQDKGNLSEEEAREYFIQIVNAINYCHRKRLIHRDLKLENILLLAKGSRKIKIVDFGVAGLATNTNISEEAGSLKYMPPEVLSGKDRSVTPAIDLWAMGCILFGLVCGELPFNGNSNKEITKQICEGKFSYPAALEKQLSREIKDLIRRILVVDPQERFTIPDIERHPWFLGEKLLVEELPLKKDVAVDEIKKDKKPGLKEIRDSKIWKSENNKRPGKDPSPMDSHALTGPKKKASIFFTDDMAKPNLGTQTKDSIQNGTPNGTRNMSPLMKKSTLDDRVIADTKQTKRGSIFISKK